MDLGCEVPISCRLYAIELSDDGTMPETATQRETIVNRNHVLRLVLDHINHYSETRYSETSNIASVIMIINSSE